MRAKLEVKDRPRRLDLSDLSPADAVGLLNAVFAAKQQIERENQKVKVVIRKSK